MIINFDVNEKRQYIDKNAARCAKICNKFFSTLFEYNEIKTNHEYAAELQKILPCKITMKKQNFGSTEYIYEIDVDEKEYVMFLLKYDI